MRAYPIAGMTTLNKDDDAGRVEAFLKGQGIKTAGVSVRWDEMGRVFVTVNADQDPAAALESYTPTLTTEEQERADVLADAQAAIAQITGKTRADRTDTERVLLALAVTADTPVLMPSTPEEPVDPVGVPSTPEEPVERLS